MSVDLRGLEICVTQQFLDNPEIRPSIEQMGGKGVTQGVGVGRNWRSPVQQSPNVSRAQSISASIEEECIPGTG
jgi:hypothetical protein